MFGSYDVFSIFSRIRFRDNFSIREKDSQPSQNNKASTADAPVTKDSNAAAELLPVAKTAPTDTVELSKDNPAAPIVKAPVTYAPKTAKPEKTPSKDKKCCCDDGEPEPESQNQLLKSKSMAKIDLNMVFNLSDFQRLVTAVSEDAQDGQLDTTAYSNLNLGFHADLDAKALIKETYKTAEGQDNSADEIQNSIAKTKYSNLEASLVKGRGFEAATFYRESLNSSSRIRQSNRDGYLHVARKLSVRYTQDFHLNMKTMSQFNSQAVALDKTGDLQSYLGNTEALVDNPQSSADLIGQFFDTVGTYLDGAEDKLIEKVEGFMDKLATEMGINSDLLSGAKEALVTNIRDFFDRVDTAISSVKAYYMPQPAQPEVIEPPQNTEPSPDLVGASEVVAAA